MHFLLILIPRILNAPSLSSWLMFSVQRRQTCTDCVAGRLLYDCLAMPWLLLTGVVVVNHEENKGFFSVLVRTLFTSSSLVSSCAIYRLDYSPSLA
jgi:hypothetical protein